MDIHALEGLAHEMRISILEMITEAQSGHPGGCLSAIDVMTALFFNVMQGVDSLNQTSEKKRDHFILSKGHAAPALYALLAKKGFFPVKELKTLRQIGSRLQGHPDRVRLPIVEASTGSLGQGLSVALGMALGLRYLGSDSYVYCMIGDGEMQEGQIWEASMAAAKFKVSRLCVILDSNNGQIDGPVTEVMPLEPIAEKWKAFGWNVHEMNGHEMPEILKAFQRFKEQSSLSQKPFFILARTVKGKGVSFMENQIGWHGVAPSREQCLEAILEIKAKIL